MQKLKEYFFWECQCVKLGQNLIVDQWESSILKFWLEGSTAHDFTVTKVGIQLVDKREN